MPAALATALGTAGHLLAGGVVSTGPVVLALVLAGVPAWLLTGRERGWLTIAGAQLVLGQVVHAALSAGHPHDATGLLPHDLMLYAHVLAALMGATALRVGERRVWAAARRLSGRVAAWWRGLTGVGAPVTGPAPVPVRSPDRPCHPGLLLRHSRALRGPPARPA
ncbi:hypothetical protein [Pseudonocardia hydrocarbonoxydans]|uniref:Uncharacterized protein n=1 Tax=Pseudonocardia hydrocarbonoxydans TaxID=76726 RepID=A0A4Y3WS94_9PSEU|nr:hypothetical protein [Pseudonocardia hydrocarbonoxydans]GEC21725.1 hypothetical protein PHY01_40080 [Pseudonocardia hydrocarbonoxydans]